MTITFCVLIKKFFLTQDHEDFLLEAPLFYMLYLGLQDSSNEFKCVV